MMATEWDYGKNHNHCPFCGSIDLAPKNVWSTFKFIACGNCKAGGPVRKTEEQAWEAWDARVVRPKPVEPKYTTDPMF